ncbi:MAG: hypothetical protein U0795_07215 [Pirellulales bacterium]
MSEVFVPRLNSMSKTTNAPTPTVPLATDHGLPEPIVEIFREHVADLNPAEIQESLLIRNGHYCGQKLVYAGWTVIWFVEEGQLKVFGPDGQLERVCRLTPTPQHTAPARRAA